MNKLKGFGVFFIAAGLIIAIIGIVALTSATMTLNGGPVIAAGIAIAMLGVVTLLALLSHNVSYHPNEH